MAYAQDPRVDDYIDPLPKWQREICRKVRDLIHEADPEIEETIKRNVQIESNDDEQMTAIAKLAYKRGEYGYALFED